MKIIIKNLEKLQKNLGNYVENVPQNLNFVHFKPQIKKNGNPGTRVLRLKNLTRPKAKNPGLNPGRVPGFPTLIMKGNNQTILKCQNSYLR